MIHSQIINNNFRNDYPSDLMDDVLEMFKEVGCCKFAEAKHKRVLDLNDKINFPRTLTQEEMSILQTHLLVKFKEMIAGAIPADPGSCCVIFIKTDVWSFLAIKRNQKGELEGVYNNPLGEPLKAYESYSISDTFSITTDIPSVLKELRVNNIKDHQVKFKHGSKADSGKFAIDCAVQILFTPGTPLQEEVSTTYLTDASFGRIIDCVVPHIIKNKFISADNTYATNLYQNFINSHLNPKIASALVRAIFNDIGTFGFQRDVIQKLTESYKNIHLKLHDEANVMSLYVIEELQKEHIGVVKSLKSNILKSCIQAKALEGLTIKLSREELERIDILAQDIAADMFKNSLKETLPSELDSEKLFEYFCQGDAEKLVQYIKSNLSDTETLSARKNHDQCLIDALNAYLEKVKGQLEGPRDFYYEIKQSLLEAEKGLDAAVSDSLSIGDVFENDRSVDDVAAPLSGESKTAASDDVLSCIG